MRSPFVLRTVPLQDTMKTSLASLLLMLVCSSALGTEPSPVILVPAVAPGFVRVIKLELGPSQDNIQTFVALEPLPPVVAPANSSVEFYSTVETDTAPIWTKNGVAIVATDRVQIAGRTLRIDRLVPEDAGWYSTSVAQKVNLRIGQSGALINSSARAQVGANDQILVSGLVISGTRNKKMLLRAIGPGLAKFAVSNCLAEPKLEIFDSKGAKYSNQYAYAAYVGGPGQTDLADSTKKVGAFPLEAGSKDVAQLHSMAPGLYTIHISGLNGTTGVALVEVYEVEEE